MNNAQDHARLNPALLPRAAVFLAAILCVTLTLHPVPAFCYVPTSGPV